MKADLVDYLEVNPFWCFFCATPSVLGAGFLLKINVTDMIIRKLIELKPTKMLIKKPFFYAIFYSAVVFIVSLFVLPYYIDGDQFYYRDFYKYCFYESLTLSQQFDCYQTTLASSEPGYFILSKLANAFLDKDLYIAIANAILTFIFSILVFKNYKAVWHRHVFLILLLTNYYLIVMFFAAERLKFSFIFLALALLISDNKKLFLFFGAMFIHIQSALLIGPYYIAQVFDKSESKWIKVLTIVGFIIVFAIALFVLKDHIESKFTSYSNKTEESGSGVLGSIKTAVFIIFASISTKKLLPLITGMPLVVMAYFLGSDRIGMLAFILYAGLVLYYKRSLDALLFITMLYFSYKSIEFISNIFIYGEGYKFV